MARRATKIRVVPTAETGPLVLTARGGRVRGETILRNEGSEPVTVPDIPIKVRVPRAHGPVQIPTLGPPRPLVLAPGGSERTQLTATLDPLTPPGTYEAEILLNGDVQKAVLQVTDDIALTLSESELVVIGEPGLEQVRRMVATNRGNVPLLVRVIGPVELDVDRPRSTLLQRLGVFAREDEGDDESEDSDESDDDEHDEPPTVRAELKTPVTIDPGESLLSEWTVTVEGPLRPGARYRASAPLYTTDITFVVTPSQEPPPAQPPPARAPAPSEKRRDT